MKNLLVVLSVVLAAVSFQASAATLTQTNLGYISNSATFGNTVTGSFQDTYLFTAPENSGIGGTLSSVAVTLRGIINPITVTLDGTPFSWSQSVSGVNTFTFLLGEVLGSPAGQHSLVVSGFGRNRLGNSYSGTISVAQTPIPAAIWLFGSAFMGLTGIARRKRA